MRVLLARGGALGDLVLLREGVAALRAAGHSVALFAPPPGEALVGPGPAEADERVPWESPAAAALFTGGAEVEETLAGAVRRCGHAVVFSRSLELASALRRLVPSVVRADPAPERGHAAEWLLRALADLAPPLPSPATLRPTTEESEAARPLLDSLPEAFACVHPGSGSPGKCWPAARFASLVRAIAPRQRWLLVEGPADERAATPLREEPGAVLARGLPLRVLGALLAHAGLFVGNDSGVSHLAAAYGAPALALFGPTDPGVWSPRGPRARCLRAPGGNLERLAVEVVAAATRELRRAATSTRAPRPG